MVIDPLALTNVGGSAERWEKVVHKLRALSMPPPGAPRPDAAVRAAPRPFPRELDRAEAAHPHLGALPLTHRLSRTEYRNAVRDLLALEALPREVELDYLLPPDNISSGFDNIADLLFVSPNEPRTVSRCRPPDQPSGRWRSDNAGDGEHLPARCGTSTGRSGRRAAIRHPRRARRFVPTSLSDAHLQRSKVEAPAGAARKEPQQLGDLDRWRTRRRRKPGGGGGDVAARRSRRRGGRRGGRGGLGRGAPAARLGVSATDQSRPHQPRWASPSLQRSEARDEATLARGRAAAARCRRSKRDDQRSAERHRCRVIRQPASYLHLPSVDHGRGAACAHTSLLARASAYRRPVADADVQELDAVLWARTAPRAASIAGIQKRARAAARELAVPFSHRA